MAFYVVHSSPSAINAQCFYTKQMLIEPDTTKQEAIDRYIILLDAHKKLLADNADRKHENERLLLIVACYHEMMRRKTRRMS